MRRERKPAHKRWACPKCGATLTNPIPVLEAVCQRVAKHANKKTVAMKPVKEDA